MRFSLYEFLQQGLSVIILFFFQAYIFIDVVFFFNFILSPLRDKGSLLLYNDFS